MIKTQQDLDDFLALIINDWELALDTEFRRVDTYYPQLCLIQIATIKTTVCIDVLAQLNLSALFAKLYHPKTLLIIHSSRQDLEVLYNLTNQLPAQLFDTQIIAWFMGYQNQVSYQQLVKDELAIELKKSHSRFDFRIRPLPKDALQYAIDDVIYLLKLYAKFKNYCNLDWALQDCKQLLNEDLYKIDSDNAYKKVKGIGNLNFTQQQLAIKLSAYRELKAIEKNKPRQWIFNNKTLLDYACNITKITKFNLPIIKQIKIIQPKPPTNTEKQHIKKLQKVILTFTNKYNLALEVFASKKTILRYIRGDKNIFKGWRQQILK